MMVRVEPGTAVMSEGLTDRNEVPILVGLVCRAAACFYGGPALNFGHGRIFQSNHSIVSGSSKLFQVVLKCGAVELQH